MLARKKDKNQLTFNTTLEEQLIHNHPLYALAGIIDWNKIEIAFEKYYSPTDGRPAKRIRLMVGLLIIKHLRNLSDESLVEQWQENLYYQYFCGERIFNQRPPCEASELVHFRNRIGEKGMQLIFQESIRIANEISNNKGKTRQDKRKDKSDKGDGSWKEEKEVIVDTTVQEKNITFPTDDKLYKVIIKKCVKIAEVEGIELRQNYKRTIKKLSYQQRFRKSKRQNHLAKKASRRIKTIAGRLVRELPGKLTPTQMEKYSTDIELFKRVLSQKREDKNKVYSLHEPHTECISKGKAHKKYEFGNKVSIIIGKKTGVILGALSLEKNDYDGHTLPKAMEQFKEINGYEPNRAIVDLGYRGVKQIGKTEIVTPKSGNGKSIYQKRKQREDHRRRASIEGKISHVKHDFRMGRNFYKGIYGDSINVMLAASASNFKLWINKFKKDIKIFLLFLFGILQNIFGILSYKKLKNQPEMTF